ncbi:O-methyltransferase [Saccharothrix algeriensis]|uniref:O-methyltransferase n=1 Tax=Saccharothrix algeriensis TaxID=173560 RepID=A0A8T8I3C1_9PSEU|nr:O-methyltransferase [Saccharothrix algeriensis]MBM7811395.1 putative O-methyltransferase YrrM [Saccharothrix algeriensis]QTR05266.1 O-methyltransferase [Saccharothrix algeriensis]
MDAPLREYVERYQPEDAVIAAARARGAGLGCAPIGAGGGAALRFLATALQARAVVEIGTGAGVGALYLLGGMPAAGVLTSIDVEPEHQRAARVAFAEAGIAVSRTRLIMGRALDVLPRLTDGAYDLVFVDAAKAEYPRYLDEGVRLLRPGGVIAFDNVLWNGKVVDQAHRDPVTVAMRDVVRAVRDDDRLVPVLLPLGDGLLVAAKTP